MSIELTQKLVAGTIIVGGLGGGYYALTGGSGSTLKNYHLNEGRELVTNWDALAAKYISDENKDLLIDGIKKTDNKAKDKIKKWCESKGSTYCTDTSDKTYQSYSLWCLVESDLNTVLTKQGYLWQDEHDKWEKKFQKYTDSHQDFLNPPSATAVPPPKPPKTPKVEKMSPTKADLKAWCEKAKQGRYKYQGEDEERKTRIYCYWSAAQLEEANKPAEPEAGGASLPQPPQEKP